MVLWIFQNFSLTFKTAINLTQAPVTGRVDGLARKTGQALLCKQSSTHLSQAPYPKEKLEKVK